MVEIQNTTTPDFFRLNEGPPPEEVVKAVDVPLSPSVPSVR